MTLVFESVPSGSTLYLPFATYGGTNGESITLTGLAVTDIEIYKDGSATQRASDNGYALLDTDGIDFDGITGIHGFSVDLADNSDAGFYAVGSWYWVVVSAVTVDSQTVNFIAAVFRIGPAETVTGYRPVDTAAISGDATAADNLEAAADGTGYNLGGGSVVAASVTGNVGGNVVGSVASVTGNVGGNVTGSVGSLGTTAKANVNAEVLDVLDVDTFSEPGQGAPPASTTIRGMLHYLYKFWRNKKENDGSQTSLYADDGTTIDQKQTTSDAGGTTTFDEWTTGA